MFLTSQPPDGDFVPDDPVFLLQNLIIGMLQASGKQFVDEGGLQQGKFFSTLREIEKTGGKKPRGTV